MRLARLSSAARRGFTLIELLAVILIISILAVALVPMVTDAVDSAKVSACQKNLTNIHGGILIHQTKFKRLPSGSGVRFFTDLYTKKALENSKKNAEIMTCPAVDLGALTIGELPWEEWWSDTESIGGDYTAYAGRDTKRHKLRKLTGTEPLIADDNDGAMNHATTTNVLYGDGSVQSLELTNLVADGSLMEDEILLVGPDSPVEDLRKLSLD